VTGSDDRLAIILLCTSIGRARGISDLPVIGPVGWANIELRLAAIGMRPGQLLSLPPDSLKDELGLSADQAARVAKLLARAGPVAIELERLADRGFWHMTALDEDYPARLRQTLGKSAPPALFGAGPRSLLSAPSLAIVGSRDASEESLGLARTIARAGTAGNLVIASGGARGVDQHASQAALDGAGSSIVVAPEHLERRVREPSARAAIAASTFALVSPYSPGAGFSVRGAMGRNRIVYGLSRAAIVVHAKRGEGGTWAGATEALKGYQVPVFVPDGTEAWIDDLIRLGAHRLPWHDVPEQITEADLVSNSFSAPHGPVADQATLFDDPALSTDGHKI
jgi:Predicted Rossmann fold nucleotide-binding protein involved in DNA uptake